jgi:hypothetical protein
MNQLDKIKNKLKNLQQNKTLSDTELTSLAREKLEKDEIITSLKFCANEEERKFAQDLLQKYLSTKSFENPAERDTLRNLIDFEVILDRVKNYINIETSKANPVPPVQMIEQLQKFSEHIEELKESLALTQSAEQSDFIKTWDLLKKKALKYYEENKGINTVKCPYCQNLFQLLFDRTDYKEMKAVWFRGTQLYNEPLLKLYHEKVITEDKVAEILGVSNSYVKLLYEDIFIKDLEKTI